MFQEGLSTDTVGAGAAFTDVDYTEANKFYNRVKNYSFARENSLGSSNREA